MKRVKYYEYEREKGEIYYEPVWKEEATFIKFGLDSNDDGGTFTTGILQLDDGSMRNVPIEQIVFLELVEPAEAYYWSSEYEH